MIEANNYADNLATQLRKGFLSYCVLKICQDESKYTSDIIATLQEADMVVVEGTIYPLLSRLQRDGMLQHEWHESDQGPPRKYYQTTELGKRVADNLTTNITNLNKTLQKL